jgi:hypothetical protein
MKKKSNFYQKGLLFIVLVFFSNLCVIAQSNAISISVSGVEYDDPSFSLLKESLQKDKNVTSVKSAYEQGTAKLTFICTHKAQDLWDELSKTTKQFFKITTINDNSIVLESKSAIKESTVVKPNATGNQRDDVCANCYYNLCNYDGTKSFQGVVYRAINYDQGTYYYNCDNGVVIRKTITVNGYGVTTNIQTDTILMSNSPIGTTWGVINNPETYFGSIKGYNFFKWTLVAKGLTQTVDGKTYKDVIVVNSHRKAYDGLFDGDNSFSINYYYAKGVGIIKQEKLDPSIEPLATIHGNQPVSVANIPEMKGAIDPDLVGAWLDKDPSGFSYTYKFYADGTYEYYVGQDLSYKGSRCFWRLDGSYLNLFCTGWPNVYKQEFQKKKDAATGKKAIVIQFKGTEYRTYVLEE